MFVHEVEEEEEQLATVEELETLYRKKIKWKQIM